MYSLDTKNAKENVAKAYAKPLSRNILESGKYNVVIDCAIWTDYSGWKGLELHFLDENEQKARISLTYESNEGKRFFGADQIDAIMVCTAIRNLTAANDTYVMWSKAEQSFVEQEVKACPELKGKSLTLLLQKELDAYNSNEGVKETEGVRIYGAYQLSTGLSASEILDRKTIAEDIVEAQATLEKNPLFITKRHKTLMSGNAAKKPTQNNSYASKPANAQPSLDEDDDLPF